MISSTLIFRIIFRVKSFESSIFRITMVNHSYPPSGKKGALDTSPDHIHQRAFKIPIVSPTFSTAAAALNQSFLYPLPWPLTSSMNSPRFTPSGSGTSARFSCCMTGVPGARDIARRFAYSARNVTIKAAARFQARKKSYPIVPFIPKQKPSHLIIRP